MVCQFLGCFVGALLLSAAWAKVRDPGTFLEIVRTYPLPNWLPRTTLAWSLPWLEGVLGLVLLLPVGWLTSVGLAGALTLVGLATAAVAMRWLRGEKRFRCGCGGDLSEDQSAIEVLLRNGALIALLAVALAGASETPGVLAPLLPVYLSAIGLLAGLKLASAALRAWRAIHVWKVSG